MFAEINRKAMKKVRIEIHFTEEEIQVIDQIASQDFRTRKNFCETEIRKLIERLRVKTNIVAAHDDFNDDANDDDLI